MIYYQFWNINISLIVLYWFIVANADIIAIPYLLVMISLFSFMLLHAYLNYSFMYHIEDFIKRLAVNYGTNPRVTTNICYIVYFMLDRNKTFFIPHKLLDYIYSLLKFAFYLSSR